MSSEKAKQLAEKYGYLSEAIERFLRLYGLDFTTQMLEGYEQPPKMTIRINTLRKTKGEIIKRLAHKGIILKETEEYDLGFYVEKSPFPIGATTEYLSGYYFIQSKASWIPVLLLNPQPNEVIIDLAAAPGGKATHIAQLQKNAGILFCIDISNKRMRSLRSNLARCGVENVINIRTDGRKISSLDIKVDKILLDAPCSGEGLMAIDKKRRMSKSVEDIERLAKLQKELLQSAIKSLKVGGSIVYSTCSTAPEENEEVIDWALNRFPLKIQKIESNKYMPGLTEAFGRHYKKELANAIRLYPHLHGTEGFFVAKLTLEEII